MKNVVKFPLDVYIDMDGTLTEFMYVVMSVLYRTGYFLNLPPQLNVVEAVKMLVVMGVRVTVISCYLADHPTAYQEKVKWLEKELPGVPYILLPCGEDKAQKVKELIGKDLSSSEILIDDHSPNLIAWEKAGGRGIKLINSVNGKGQKWKGERLYYDDPDLIVHLLEALHIDLQDDSIKRRKTHVRRNHADAVRYQSVMG